MKKVYNVPDADLELLSFHPLFVASKFLQEYPVRVHTNYYQKLMDHAQLRECIQT